MSKSNRGLILAGAIIALCMSVLFVIVSILNLTTIGVTINLIKEGAGFAAIFNLIRIILTAVLAVLMLIYSIMLCKNPEKTGHFEQYRKKNVCLIVFVSIMIFVELLGMIILFDILAIVDMLILTTSLVLLIVGYCKDKKETPSAVMQQNVVNQTNGVKEEVNQPKQQTFDCDLDNLIDHKIYRVRQLHADGILTDEEMKELLIEIIKK